jgi:hypothetical protein
MPTCRAATSRSSPSTKLGATVVVLGDNGVSVDGDEHPLGARFLWKAGETMQIGRAGEGASACTLSLAAGA